MYIFVLIRFYSFLFCILISSWSYGQITASQTAGCAPLTVNFAAPSGMTTYYWDFDNGGSSEDANPNVVFSNPKNPYTVSLRACKTCPILSTLDIQVYPKPNITIPSEKGCAPLDVTFNPVLVLPPNVNVTSLKYIFGDGNSQTKTPPNLTPASNRYNDPDKTHTVSFEIKTSPTDAGCDHTVVIPGAVETSSIRLNSLQSNPSAACTPPLNVNFSYNVISQKPIVSYEWNFGDGNTSTVALPTHTYTQAGTFTVRLKVKNSLGCEQEQTSTVTIRDNDVSKIISLDTVCVRTLLELNRDGNSGLISQWALGNGGVTFGKPVYDYYSTPGLKTVTLTTYYPGNTCIKTITKKILAIEPKIEHTIVPRPLCNKKNTFTLTCTNAHLFSDIEWRLHLVRKPGDTIFLRTLGANFIQPVTHTLNLDSIPWKYDKLILMATATSKYGGCKAQLIDPNFIDPLIAHVAPTITSGCKPLKVGFYDRTLLYRKDTIVEWKLVFGDGSEVVRNSFKDTFYHTYTDRGDYYMYMVAKNKYDCSDTTYLTKIEVGDSHSADFTITPSGSLCASDPTSSITLQSLVSRDSVQQTKFWTDGFQCVQYDNLTFTPNKRAGNYPIKMEVVDRGCFSQTTKMITIKGPIAKFITTQYCDTPRKVVFTNQSQEADSFRWHFGDGLTSADNSPTHYYAKDSLYIVKFIAYYATNGCPPDTYSLPVTIQTPQAKFSKDTYFFCHNDIVQMLSAKESKGYIKDGKNTGFIWEFINGRAPTRTFEDSLNYNVHTRLIDNAIVSVRNFMNCISRDSAVVIVDEVVVNCSITPNILCNKDTVKYSGTISSLLPIVKEFWNHGDDKNTNKLDTFHVYNFRMRSVSSFTNTFYAETSKGCFRQEMKTLPVKKINLELEPYSNNLCLQSSSIPVSITSKVNPLYPSSIRWQTPDNTIRYGKTIDYFFTSTGNFNFNLIATDSSNANCVDTLSPANVVVHKKPNLTITSDKDTLNVLCNPVNLDLAYVDSNNTSILTRKWFISDSTGTTTYNNNLTISRSMHKGLNKVQLIATTNYCNDTIIKDYIVRAPSGSMTIDKNDICKGDEIVFTVNNLIDVSDYSVDLGDGNVVKNTPLIKHRYNYVPLGGKTVAKGIFLASGFECVGKPIDTTIRIHEVFAKFSIDGVADTPICFRGVLIQDSSIGADKYFWNFGDGSAGTMKEPGIKNYVNAGKYQVSLAIESTIYGCKDTFKDSVHLKPLPQSIPTNDTICFGNSAKIYQQISQSTVKYTWSPIGKLLNNQSDTVYYNPDSSFQFTTTAFDTISKCKKDGKGSVYVVYPMRAQIFDTILAPGSDVVLPFSPSLNYGFYWEPDSFLDCLDCSDPLARYLLRPITYKAIFYDKFKNCFRDTSIYKIDIYPDILVNAPTAFTPNGDGNNDIYYARGFGIKKLTSLKIYNRQGSLLFYSTSEQDGWDGNYKGIPQNSDTYFYTIEGESYIPNKRVFKEGNFMLLR